MSDALRPVLGGKAGGYSAASIFAAALIWFANDAQAQLRELRERMARLEYQIDRIADQRCNVARSASHAPRLELPDVPP